MLSVRKIQHAKPGRHSDGDGLYLLVKPSGSKSWVLRVHHNGRRRDFGLGTAITSMAVDLPIEKRRSLTLAQAREKARLGRELAKAGIDTSSLWRPKEEDIVPTFKKVATEYRSQVSKGCRNGKHTDQWLTFGTIFTSPFGLAWSKPRGASRPLPPSCIAAAPMIIRDSV